jgi:hypothetical protein
MASRPLRGVHRELLFFLQYSAGTRSARTARATRRIHVARAVADIEPNEDCPGVVRDAHFLCTIADRYPRRCIEPSGYMAVAALAVTKLLLKSKELLSGQAGGAGRCRTSPRTRGSVRRRNWTWTEARIPRCAAIAHREGRSSRRRCGRARAHAGAGSQARSRGRAGGTGANARVFRCHAGRNSGARARSGSKSRA